MTLVQRKFLQVILDEVSTATFPATESCLKYRSDLELQRVPCRTVENPSWDLKRPRRREIYSCLRQMRIKNLKCEHFVSALLNCGQHFKRLNCVSPAALQLSTSGKATRSTGCPHS